jgi:hypothetical protein
MWERLERRYTRLFFILGGLVFIIDGIGRIETVAELCKGAKGWLASWSNIHLAWPPHTLFGVGVFFLMLGLISFVWPKHEVKPADTLETAPHVDLIFDLPRSDSVDVLRDDKIKVVNTTDTIAYDVSIQPKESHLYSATFETIARLEKGHAVYAVMDLRSKQHGTCFSQFEALLKFELENSSENDDFKVHVPLTVRFYDAKKEILYRTEHEVVYDAFWHEAHIHLRQGTSPIKLPYQHSPATVTTPDGVTKVLVKYIMRGTQQQLFAYETTRDGFPGTRFLVERVVPNQERQSCLTTNREEANIKWHEWFKEWEKQPGGFGGSFGTGLDGRLPW